MVDENVVLCAGCIADVHISDVFPGVLCVTCYEKKMNGIPLPTVDEIVAMWGGPGYQGEMGVMI
jgi:hypothetical protein